MFTSKQCLMWRFSSTDVFEKIHKIYISGRAKTSYLCMAQYLFSFELDFFTFKVLPNGLMNLHTEALKRENITKNRFKKIYPCTYLKKKTRFLYVLQLISIACDICLLYFYSRWCKSSHSNVIWRFIFRRLYKRQLYPGNVTFRCKELNVLDNTFILFHINLLFLRVFTKKMHTLQLKVWPCLMRIVT